MFRALFIMCLFTIAVSCARNPMAENAMVQSWDANIQFPLLKHSPLHPADYETINIYADLHSDIGLSKVELYVYEYELYKNKNGHPSKRKKDSGKWGLMNTWEFPSLQDDVNLEYEISEGFGPSSSISYEIVAYDGLGDANTQTVMFDAGASEFEKDKILLYKNNDRSIDKAINICFIADTDYEEDWDLFVTDLEKLIFEGYLANNMIKDYRANWNFFYAKNTLDGQALFQNFNKKEFYPSYLVEDKSIGIQSYGLIHKEDYDDASFLQGNLSFLKVPMFTSEASNPGTAIHETGHTIFNLFDEYDGCVCTTSQNGPNMFTELSACIEFVIDHKLPMEHCTEIKNYKGENWYMPEDHVFFETQKQCQEYNTNNGYPEKACTPYVKLSGITLYRADHGLCIMQDDGNHMDHGFQSVCSHIIANHYKQYEQNFDAGVAEVKKPTSSMSKTINRKTTIEDDHLGMEAVLVSEKIEKEIHYPPIQCNFSHSFSE